VLGRAWPSDTANARPTLSDFLCGAQRYAALSKHEADCAALAPNRLGGKGREPQ
jgi:hypothetical protein